VVEGSQESFFENRIFLESKTLEGESPVGELKKDLSLSRVTFIGY